MSHPIQTPTVDDRGTPIFIRYTQRVRRNGKMVVEPLDVSAATMTCRVIYPNGDERAPPIALVPSEDEDHPPDDGWAQFIPADSDAPESSFFGIGGPGRWEFLPRYRLGPGQQWRHAAPIYLRVAA